MPKIRKQTSSQLDLFSASSVAGDKRKKDFAPVILAEAPAEVQAMPSGSIEEKIAKAKSALKWLLTNYRTAWSVSFGKDSSTTLGLAMATAAELASEGTTVQPFVVLTADTKVENPLIHQLAAQEIAKVRDWIARFSLPGSTHVAMPSLANEFAVSIIGGRAL